MFLYIVTAAQASRADCWRWSWGVWTLRRSLIVSGWQRLANPTKGRECARNIARNERTVSFDVVEIMIMWLSVTLNSVMYVVNAVNLVAYSKQTRELRNVDKGCQKRQYVGFYAQNFIFLLVYNGLNGQVNVQNSCALVLRVTRQQSALMLISKQRNFL